MCAHLQAATTPRPRWSSVLSPTQRRRKLAFWAVVGMLLLAFALRAHILGVRELGFDEVASVYIAARGPVGLLAYVRGAIREHPPFYYLLLSLWMPLAGESEFAVRFLSVGIGLTTVAMAYRLVRKATRQSAALLTTLLLVLSPFHIHESQNARMYGLLALCSLISIFIFIRLLSQDRARWWGLFWLVTGLGMSTHYYMALVLLAQDLFLLFNWRRYRRILPRWLAIHVAAGSIVALWVTISPGLWATLLSFWERGAASSVRWNGLFRALNGLYLGATVHPNWLHLGLPLLLTALGVGVAQWLNPWLPRGHRHGGMLLGLLIGVPLVAVLALPERVTGRYLAAVQPASVLATALLLEWLADVRPRLSRVGKLARRFAWIPLLLWLIFLDINSYPLMYEMPNESLRARIEYLRARAQPDDGLLLHGPWQQLLLTYYDPGISKRYTAPLNGLRVDANLVAERLPRMFETHDRVWTSYDSVKPVDPDGVVARWLHEHAYRVWSEGNLVLYYAVPAQESSPGLAESVRFGKRLLLEDVSLANVDLASGEAVLLRTEWRALQDIAHRLTLSLELSGPAGQVWETHRLHAGPFRSSTKEWDAGETFVERCGLVIPIGAPAGDYTLRLRVFPPEGEWSPEGEDLFEVGTIHVGHSAPTAEALGILPGRELRATFGDTLALAGYGLGGLRFTQGNPVMFSVYWQALTSPPEAYELGIRFVADDGTVLLEEHGPMVADWSPTDHWLAGDVLQGYYVLTLPLDTPPGHYQINLSIHAPDEPPLPVDGTRAYKVLDWLPREQTISGTELTLFEIQVEERPRVYRPPAMQHHVDVVLGDDVKLLGYDLADTSVKPGGTVGLTFYWQALRRMDTYYAVFNHLVGPDGTTVAQVDGWPKGGTYPTLQWLPGEVVRDSYTILLPPDLPPGEYTLLGGMYDAATNERPVTIIDGVLIPERHVVLTTITVEE
jgi:hypothetical protein